MAREIPGSSGDGKGSFRAWLRQVTVNRVRTYRRQRSGGRPSGSTRPTASSTAWPTPTASSPGSGTWSTTGTSSSRLLAVVRARLRPTTWEAFRRFALDGLPAAQVAQELGLTENAVLQAKSRILKRLREEAGELLG